MTMKRVLNKVLFLAFITACHAQPLTELKVPERPEGITEGPGSTLYVSQIISGKVLAVDADTGVTEEVVGEQPDREAWGLWYHEIDDTGYLFVAGGGPSYGNGVPEIYMYNVETGESVVACSPIFANNETGNGVFINDVAVFDGIAYATNSFSNRILAMDIDWAMTHGNCSVEEMFLPNNFVPLDPDDWGTNGIAPYDLGNGARGLFVSNEKDGTVFAVTGLDDKGDNGMTIPRYQQVIGHREAPGADGLVVLKDKLYVTQNTLNKIGVYGLAADDNGVLVVTELGELTSPDFDTPATSAIYNGYIYATNSRFVTLPDIASPADNNVIGVLNTFEEAEVPEPPPVGETNFEIDTAEAQDEGEATTGEGTTEGGGDTEAPPPDSTATHEIGTESGSERRLTSLAHLFVGLVFGLLLSV